MKTIIYTLFIAFAFVACKNEPKTDKNSDAGKTIIEAEVNEKVMDKDGVEPTNYVHWEGKKVIGGGHNGKAQFSKVNLNTVDGKVVGGEIIVDLSTIVADDLEGEQADKLAGHLKNEDFFHVEKYPTAKFTIGDIEYAPEGSDKPAIVNGVLTIKDVSKDISAPAIITVAEDGKVTLTSDLVFNRTDFGVNYGSGTKFTDLAKDKVIHDEVKLKVVINQ